MKALWRMLISIRTALVLMGLLATMLLLNIAIPQRAVLGDAAFRARAGSSAGAKLVLVTLGLGSIPTNPVFVGLLGLFFLSLGCSLVNRVRPILKHSQVTPPSPGIAAAWLAKPVALSAPLPEGWSERNALRMLQLRGYRVSEPGARCFWGVRHPSAPLGFALFHASFFVLCAGGVMLYGTRFVGRASVVEGTRFDGSYQPVMRHAPWYGTPDVRFGVEKVEWKFENGELVHLGATIDFLRAGGSEPRATRVNHPAEWGPVTVLIQRAGLAPQFWLQNTNGYTLDRVVVAARTLAAEPTVAPLDHGRLEIVIPPLRPDQIPDRQALMNAPMRLQVHERKAGKILFDGALRRGEAIAVGADRLVLQDLKMWAGLLVVSERGGSLLIAGFVLGVAGLGWRMLWYRRELFLGWDDERVTIAGRSDIYPLRYREELEEVLAAIAAEGSVSSEANR